MTLSTPVLMIAVLDEPEFVELVFAEDATTLLKTDSLAVLRHRLRRRSNNFAFKQLEGAIERWSGWPA